MLTKKLLIINFVQLIKKATALDLFFDSPQKSLIVNCQLSRMDFES